MPEKPKLSIISPSRNTGKYLKDTIESVMAQSYKDWEHIVVDGGSTDETLEILKKYPHVRWISEKDSSADEAFRKGLAMAKGDYVMLCCVSDGYINKNWFKTCTEVLDNEPEISLVWGIDQNIQEDGTPDKIVRNDWFQDPPPSGREYIYYWLKRKTLFHERTMCVRKNVMEECFPHFNREFLHKQTLFLEFYYHFNARGYLPRFIPKLAAFARYNPDTLSNRLTESGDMYNFFYSYDSKFYTLKRDILLGRYKFRYRDGRGGIIPGGLDRLRVLLDTGYRDMIYMALHSVPVGLYLKMKALRKQVTGKNF